MKKPFVFIGGAILIIAMLLVLILQLNSTSSDETIYGKPVFKLDPATVKLLDNPDYQNTIPPQKLSQMINEQQSFFVYFYASDCKYCLVTTPHLVQLSKELGVEIVMLNLKESKEHYRTYNIQYVPTLAYYQNGEEVDRLVGGIEEEPNDGGIPLELFKGFLSDYSKK